MVWGRQPAANDAVLLILGQETQQKAVLRLPVNLQQAMKDKAKTLG
jgi:hypothetical protein